MRGFGVYSYMLTLTKTELIEIIYRPQGIVPEWFVKHTASSTDNTELCRIASESMRIRVEYIGSGLFMTSYKN